METNRTVAALSRDMIEKKKEIVRLLKEDPVVRGEVKRVIREKARAELAAFRQDLVPPPTIESVVETLFPGAEVFKWDCHDQQGTVYGVPSRVEGQFLMTEGAVYLCILKNVITPEDILEAVAIGNLYQEAAHPQQFYGLVVTRAVSPKAREMAQMAHMDILLAH